MSSKLKVSASHTGERRAPNRLRPEQKSYSLLQELAFCFSKPGDLAVDRFAGIFSTGVKCFTVPCHRVLVGCELDPKCFRLTKEVLLRQFLKAALNAGTEVSLSRERAEAAEVVCSIMTYSVSMVARTMRKEVGRW